MEILQKNRFELYPMPVGTEALEKEVLKLRDLLNRTIENVNLDTAQYLATIGNLRKMIFASKAEATKYIQRSFFDEAEVLATGFPASPVFLDLPKDQETTTVPAHERKKPKRKPFPDHLKRVEIVHDLQESEKVCPTDGHTLHEIGREVLEEVEFIPAQINISRHVTIKYGCRACEEFVIKASLPERIIPKSFASPSLLAHIAVAKYQDALPLYRQENIFSRHQIDLSRTTMAEWMIKVGTALQPLVNQFYEDILESPVIHCDETPVQVLKINGEPTTKTSYMWVVGTWGPDKNIVCFDFAASRSGQTASKLLCGYQGFLQVDGYGGYNDLVSREPLVTRVGCMAHVRRKFVSYLDTIPKDARSTHWVFYLIRTIGKLYAEEAQIRSLSNDDRKAARLVKCKPILELLKKEIDHHAASVAPQSVLGKAMAYAVHEWKNIENYLEHGQCEVDNNKIENAIRPFAIGRKNWLFSDSDRGAVASANIYSAIETAKANGKNPEHYLRKVFENVEKLKTADGIESLLPYNAKT